jgi:transcription elongation factor Elf1
MRAAFQHDLKRRLKIRKEENLTEKKFKQVCECTNCGNEAEMVVTCTLADESAEEVSPKVVPKEKGKTKGHAVCAHCGGEADIWLDV